MEADGPTRWKRIQVALASGAHALLSARRARRAALAVLAASFVVFAASRGITRVDEGFVGVYVNNLTGGVSLEDRAGTRFTVPWLVSFYPLDRRVQSLVMREAPAEGARGGDAVKIKTSDGSNVSLDVQVTFRLIPEQAAQVLRDAGPGNDFADLWVRAATRAMAAREFGRLTTEEIYDATLRNERATSTVAHLNEQLASRGVEVIAVVAQDFRFYKEYEEIIKNKKLADQEVLEQQAQARLATEEQAKKVSAAEWAAKLKISEAEGAAERLRAEAKSYGRTVRLDAESSLIAAQQQAAGTQAIGLAEAQGLRESATALSGEGGVNLVALEYARQMGRITFTGVPVLQESVVGQYRVQQLPAGLLPPQAPASQPPAAAGTPEGGAR